MKTKLLVLSILALVAFAPVASADSFLLTIDHCTTGCGPAPFGIVTLTQDGLGIVDVDVSLYDNRDFLWTGFDGTFGFNIIGGPSIVVSELTAGWNANGEYEPASLKFDGAGDFMYGVTWASHGGGAGTKLPLHFTVAATGLTPSSFLLGAVGGTGDMFAADVAWYDVQGFRNTGIVGGNGSTPPPPVPEPASMLLLGTGLLGAGFLRRRRNR